PPATRAGGGEPRRPDGAARRGPQRVSRHRCALGAGFDRDDRRPRPGFRRRPVGQRRATALRWAPRVAGGPRGAGGAVPVPSGSAVWAARTARRRSGARAPPPPRRHAMKYVLLAAVAVVTLAGAVLLGAGAVPLRGVVASSVVGQLRLRGAVLQSP